jgi:hypothetical protein
MNLKNKKILIIVSTAGHFQGMNNIANLCRPWTQDITFLHYPCYVKYPIFKHKNIKHFFLRGIKIRKVNHKNLAYINMKSQNSFFDKGKHFCHWIVSMISNGIFLFTVILFAMFFYIFFDHKAKTLNSILRQVFILAIKKIGETTFLFRKLFGEELLLRLAYNNFLFGAWSFVLKGISLSKFCKKINPDIVIFPEINMGYLHSQILYSLQQNGNPHVVVFPYSLVARKEWLGHFENTTFSQQFNVYKKIIYEIFSNWTYVHKNRKLNLPIEWILSSEICNIHSYDNWLTNTYNNSKITYISDSEFHKEFYRKEGVDVSAWSILGSIESDNFFDINADILKNRKRYLELFRFNEDLPIILIALPPNQFDLSLHKNLEFNDYTSFLDSFITFIREIADKDYNIIVNCHPRLDIKEIGLMESPRFTVFQGSIEFCIPLAHLFVGCSSATIRWACECHIPVIDYDLYQYNYKDFKNLKNVASVKSFSQFKKQLKLFLNNKTYYKNFSKASEIQLRTLFNSDGMSKRRILEFLSSCT